MLIGWPSGGGIEAMRASELGIAASPRTLECAVSYLRRELAAETLATVRFETSPGRQLQIDLGQRRPLRVRTTSTRCARCCPASNCCGSCPNTSRWRQVDALPDMLARLKLTAVRDLLDGLLDEAARGHLSLRETLALLCRAEASHREKRRIQMGGGITKFPHQRTLEGADFAAQSSLNAKQVRDLTNNYLWSAGSPSVR